MKLTDYELICLQALKQYLFDKNVYEHCVCGDYVDVDDVIALVDGFRDITTVPLLITVNGTVAFTYIDGFSYDECQYILNGSEITVYDTYEDIFELFEGCDIAYINHELLDSALENSNYQFTEVEQ